MVDITLLLKGKVDSLFTVNVSSQDSGPRHPSFTAGDNGHYWSHRLVRR
jgi:hypothetical protein